ncbi:MAG: DUF4382 domain-containing protein [Bacteroidia bacterium]|nr:DUF4382 domain-containing protein [Bacteroidia bacterium]
MYDRGITNCLLLAGLFAAWLLSACQSEQLTPRRAMLAIRLTDDPAAYDQVLIDLQQVRVRTAGAGWYDVATYVGIYDLLALQNGLDTLIVQDSLPPGQIDEIRLILGPDNQVVIDSAAYPLKTPSAQSSGLKIKLQQTLVQDSLTTVVLDFDAGQSIVAQGNGGFLLKPVIRVLP